MLHFIRDSLFRFDSPLHHRFSGSLETFIAERIASREKEWFPCISHGLHSLSQKLADIQAKVIESEQRIDALQTSAANATAASDHRVDILQSTTENATKTAASELRRLEHELSQCCFLLNRFTQVSSQQPSNHFQFPQKTTTATNTTTAVSFELSAASASTVHLIHRNNHLHSHLSCTRR